MAETKNISSPPSSGTCGCEPQTETRDLQAGDRESQARIQGQFPEAQSKTSDAAQRAKQAARETTEAAKHSAREMAAQARQQVGEVADQAKTHGRNLLNEQKIKVATELHAYSDAARRAASRLEDESDTNLASYLQSAAARLESLGTHLQEHSLGDLMDEVEDMARRRPEIFFGALFVAGLAAARFMKASRRRRMQDRIARQNEMSRPAYGATSGSPYFETQPVTHTGQVYPNPAPVSVPSGGTAPANPTIIPL